jgi:Spy/CpxP family protein refolding chaperone
MMSFRVKFLSKLALLAAFAVFSMAAMAQDNSKPADPGSAATQDNTPHKGFGKHGREGFGGRHDGPGGMMGELRGIDLTDTQKQQIHSIMESNKPDQATMDQVRTLMEAKRNGTITPEQQEQLTAFKQQSREKAESIHQQIQSILTPEQIAQIEKNKREMKERWEKRRQEREQNNQQAPAKPTDN